MSSCSYILFGASLIAKCGHVLSTVILVSDFSTTVVECFQTILHFSLPLFSLAGKVITYKYDKYLGDAIKRDLRVIEDLKQVEV